MTELPFRYDVEVVGLLAAPEHRYGGRPGVTVPEQSADRRERIEVRAGFGIVGDRYAGKPAHRDASVTVLAAESVEVERLTNELRDTALNIRMLPIGTTFSKFKRLVRDLSVELGKDIEMTTEGAETELDKTVIEKLEDFVECSSAADIERTAETPQPSAF